jgi:predicted nucleic acid-binding protein
MSDHFGASCQPFPFQFPEVFVVEALDLEAQHQVSFWDALVLHAAQASGAEILYSEDLSDEQAYGSVRVVNPFKQAG